MFIDSKFNKQIIKNEKEINNRTIKKETQCNN